MSINDFISKATKTISKKLEVKEISIEEQFVTYAKSKHCHAYKLVFLNKKGFPDRTILCPQGRILFIEFKRKNKPQSPIQVKVMKLLKSLGFEYYVCDTKGQAEKILDEFLAF